MTKKLLLILIVACLSIIHANAQIGPFVLKATDNTGRCDSIECGFPASASLGVDSLLGEINFIDSAFSVIDIRSIQRNTITQYPYWLSGKDNLSVLPSSENIDLKKDYRNFNQSIVFVLAVHATNFPVIITCTYHGGNDLGSLYIPYCLYSNSKAVDSTFRRLEYGSTEQTDTMFVLNGQAHEPLIGLSIQLLEKIADPSFEESIKIFPNPVSNFLHIKFPEQISSIQICDMSGRIILAKSFLPYIQLYDIDVSALPKGCYILYIQLADLRRFSQLILK